MHLMAAMTSSPGEKTCGFFVVVNKSPFEDVDTELKVSGGYLPSRDYFSMGVHRKFTSSYPSWQTSGNWYFKQEAPCKNPVPIVIAQTGDGKSLEGVMTLDALQGKSFYGDFYLTIDGDTARLWLYENIGKTVYAAAPMKMVWDREPKRMVAELTLQPKKYK